MSLSIRPEEIERLAPMPASVARLTQLVFDPAAEIPEVARIISLDPVLAASVLRWANSSWSASEVPIINVKDAVVRLGMAQLLKLAVGSRISGPMKMPFPGYELTEKELWRHSVAAGLAAERMGDFTSVPIHRAAFTAALLHDIGKILLEGHMDAEKIGKMQILIDLEHAPYIQAEREVLGADHAEVGGQIARFLKFPDELIQAIEQHHSDHPDPAPLPAAVQVANTVAKLTGIGMGREQMNLQNDPTAPGRLGLEAGTLENLCAIVLDEVNQSEELWNPKSRFY